MEKPSARQIDSWQLAELNARDWMRYWGYQDASLTPPGADAGIDVRSFRALAQVKYEARDVGRPQLQLLVGARGRNHHADLLFFTGAGYSTQAIEYAAEMGIALFKYRLDGRPVPMNAAASRIATVTPATPPVAQAKTKVDTPKKEPRVKAPAKPVSPDELVGSIATLGLFLGVAVFLFYLGFGPARGFGAVLFSVLGVVATVFFLVGLQEWFFKKDPEKSSNEHH